jgi:ribulose-phosphate 3-epimerase
MLDFVTVMTVNPGFGGQTFLTSTMSKVARLRAMAGETGRHIDIEVDGGITAETAMIAAQAGANVLIAGRSVFNAKLSVKENVDRLRQSLE